MFSASSTRSPALVKADPSRPGPEWARDDATDLALFHRALAGLCRAEVPLRDAFLLLSRDLSHGPLGAAASRLSERVAEGEPLDAALAAEGASFPPLHRALIDAGLAAGDLPAALEAVAVQAAREQRIGARVQGVLRTAAVTSGLVLGLGLLALATGGPGMLELAGQAADYGALGVTRSIEIGLAVAAGALVFLALGFVAVALPVCLPDLGARGSRRLRDRLPIVGTLVRLGATAPVLSGLGLLLVRRVPLAQALDVVAAAAQEPVAEPLRRAADAAHDGASVAESLDDGGLVPPSCLWLIEAAERRGETAHALVDVADLLQARLERHIERCATLFGPAITFLVGLVVLAFAYAFLLGPMHAMRQLIG